MRMRFIVTCLILVLSIIQFQPGYAKTTSVKLSKTKLSLEEGQTYQLKVKNTKKKISWSSSKKSVANVSSKGLVSAKNAGSATITAKTAERKLKCKVKVTKSYDHIMRNRFDDIAYITMRRGRSTYDDDGDLKYYISDGVLQDGFYDSDDTYVNVWYCNEILYYPDLDIIIFRFLYDYTSDNFDTTNDNMSSLSVQIERDNSYLCDIWTWSLDPEYGDDRLDVDKCYRDDVYREYNNLNWILGEGQGWDTMYEWADTALNLWYIHFDPYIYSMTGYYLTDLGFNY